MHVQVAESAIRLVRYGCPQQGSWDGSPANLVCGPGPIQYRRQFHRLRRFGNSRGGGGCTRRFLPEPVGNSMPLRAFIAAAALSTVEKFTKQYPLLAPVRLSRFRLQYSMPPNFLNCFAICSSVALLLTTTNSRCRDRSALPPPPPPPCEFAICPCHPYGPPLLDPPGPVNSSVLGGPTMSRGYPPTLLDGSRWPCGANGGGGKP